MKHLKSIFIMLITITVLSTCAVFEDFLNPSDLSNAVDKQYGIQISDIGLSKDFINNSGNDSFEISCKVESASTIIMVTVDSSAVGGGVLGMEMNVVNRQQYSAEISVKNTNMGKFTLTIFASNIAGYTKTATKTITVAMYEAIYVSTNGNDANDAVYPETPARTIAGGIAQAYSNSVYNIRVAKGTYTNRYYSDYCIKLRNEISISGGWNNEFTANGDYSTIDGQGNVLHVIYGSDIDDHDTIIERFIITGGVADDSLYQGDDRGGGVYLINASPTFRNCIISNNTAAMYGGGMFAKNFNSAMMDCEIVDNSVSDGNGGGLYLHKSRAVLNNNKVVSNSANGAGDAGGGGIYLSYSPVTLLSNTIINNSGSYNGGGIYLWYSSAVLISNTISFNIATGQFGSGGGIYLSSSSPDIIDNTINSNYANQDGGGLYLSSSSPTISHNTISSNSATNGSGGGLCISSSSNTILKYNSIVFNTAKSDNLGTWYGGAGLAIKASYPYIECNKFLDNSCVDNTAAFSVIYIESSYYFTLISNIIGSTSNDNAHYGILKGGNSGAVSNHTLQYNFFVTNALGFLYMDFGDSVVSNGADWANINDTNWTGALISTNNEAITYTQATNMWMQEW